MPNSNNDNFSSDLVISEEVIATIAANAAADVEGVSKLGYRPADIFTAFKIGAEDLKKVSVMTTSYDIRVHVYIELEAGVKIKEVSANVQQAVKSAIQNMTGRVVTRVDVTVTGVSTYTDSVAAETAEP